MVSGTDIAEDAARNQPGDLHAGHVAARCLYPQCVTLILGGSLVEVGVNKAAGAVPATFDLTLNRAAVGMHVEHIHEHAYLQRIAIEVGIVNPFHRNNAAIGG
jgi:hypothetical protein